MQHLKPILFLTPMLLFGFVAWRQLLTPTARRWCDPRAAAVLALPLIAVLTPTIWIYFAAVLTVMLVLPRNRAEAIGVYIFIAFMIPLSAYEIRAGDALLLKLDTNQVAALGLLAAMRFPVRGRSTSSSPIGFSIVFGLLVLLLILIASRIADSSMTVIGREALGVVLAVGIPFFVIVNAVRDEHDPRAFFSYLLLSAFILSLVATFEMLRHWPLFQSVDTHLGTSTGLSKTLAVRGGLMRAPGPFVESTTFGVFLAIGAIGIMALRSLFRSALAHQLALLVCCIGAFSTLARNGWIGLVLGAIIIGLYRGKVALTAMVVGSAALGAALLMVASSNSEFVASMTGKSGHAAQTADYREDLLTYSIPLIKARPWSGTPYDEVRKIMRPVMRSNTLSVDYVNSYLYFAVAAGFPGLLVFVAFVLYPLTRMLSTRRKLVGSRDSEELSAAVFAALVSLAVMVFFTSFFERIPLIATILTGLAALICARAGRSYGAHQIERAERKMLVVDPRNPRIVPS